MLSTLRIQNLALVDELVWELNRGLTAVTGETGAGKSVIVGALNLILGERADRAVIRSGEEKCTVEAVFDLSDTKAVDDILENAGAGVCEGGQLVLRRIISASGANKQFINCSPVTLQIMKAVGEYLVDLHGPHDHQSLLSKEHQRSLLDAFGASTDLWKDYRKAWRDWQEKLSAWKDLRDSERASEQEIDLLQHQINEIELADLDANEEEMVIERYRRSSNAVRLIELSGLIGESIDGDDGLVARMSDVQRAARELERIDPTVAPMLAGLATAAVELEELSRSVGDYREDVEVDPEEAAQLEERINLFESLKRKYGNTLGDVLEFHAKAAARLSAIQNRSGELDKLEAEAKAAEDQIVAIAEKLTDSRRKAAPNLAKQIETHLKDLGFKQSKFGVDVERLAELGPHGRDGVEFQFMPNPGEPAKPLRLIGSSGEISRVMLAVKSALADQDKVALLVFDEIDANVGGEVAHAVGAKMAGIADRRQVIVITHLAQVAARGHQHFVVDKVVQGKRTHSKLNLVESKQRVDEIARMLGGMGSESGRKHAEDLLAGARQA